MGTGWRIYVSLIYVIIGLDTGLFTPWYQAIIETNDDSPAPRSPVNSPYKGLWRGTFMLSLICALNKRLSKQSWGWWFDMASRSLWRHCNAPRPWSSISLWFITNSSRMSHNDKTTYEPSPQSLKQNGRQDNELAIFGFKMTTFQTPATPLYVQELVMESFCMPWRCHDCCTVDVLTMTSHERHVVLNHRSFNCLFNS